MVGKHPGVMYLAFVAYDFLKYVHEVVISRTPSRSPCCFICKFTNQGDQIWGQSGSDWIKSETFSDQNSVHFSSQSPFGGQSDPLWAISGHTGWEICK